VSWFVVVATIVGTVVAFMLVPMRSLGPDNWKIAAALMGSYIGGCKFVWSPFIASLACLQTEPLILLRYRRLYRYLHLL
jgi:uncharacterized membrane protein